MTNKWQLNESIMGEIIVERVEDGIPILKVIITSETGDGLLLEEQARDIANQIIDDWNFSCDELEELEDD